MRPITVYHGGTDVVEHPLCLLGREKLDFGQGFYLTDIYDQACTWAKRMRLNRGGDALLNVYTLNKEDLLKKGHFKIFTAYDLEWLRFIVANRRGENSAVAYDYIEGGVADDRVIDSINLYMSGLVGEQETLRKLAMHQPNNQICIRKQTLVDKFLHYERTEKL